MQLGKYNITFSNIGIWPRSIKLAACFFLIIIYSGFVYWFDISNQQQVLVVAQQKESKLKLELANKYQLAANLPAYKQQLQTVRDNFAKLVAQLPSENQMHSLLDEISEASKSVGLQLVTLVPQREMPQGFYAIYPLQITVRGTYDQMGNFVSKLASLNRIVIPGDYTINISKKDKEDNLPGEHLTMAMQLNTYRYLPAKPLTPKAMKVDK